MRDLVSTCLETGPKISMPLSGLKANRVEEVERTDPGNGKNESLAARSDHPDRSSDRHGRFQGGFQRLDPDGFGQVDVETRVFAEDAVVFHAVAGQGDPFEGG